MKTNSTNRDTHRNRISLAVLAATFFVGGALAACYTPKALAGSISQADERISTIGMRNDTFFYGDSCRGLLELAPDKFATLTEATDLALLEKFCSADEGMTCLDYDEQVKDWGYLKLSSSPGFCRFVPLGAN